jgi:hypothetical protein
MTLENRQTMQEFAVVNRKHRIVYTSNVLETAITYRDRVDKGWSVVKITTHYEDIA